MVYQIMVQMDSARWQHYIEKGPDMSLEYNRECIYTHSLSIQSDAMNIYNHIQQNISPGIDAVHELRLVCI